MNFGRGNYFDRNFSDSREPSFGFSNNSGFDNFARQRSPVFEDRSHFDSQIPSNFSSFSNRNFGNFSNFQQQQPSESDSSSQKVYHVPIRIERDDSGDQSNSTSNVKINDQQNSNYQQSNYHSQQPNYHPQQPNYQQQQPNYQNNGPNEQHANSSFNQQPSNFYSNVNYQPNNLKKDFKERAEQEFKRQNEELRNKQGQEYRIPIRIERNLNSESNDLVRDFNKMNCPSSAIRTNKPGQKHSTNNDFIDGRDFNNVPPSFHHQSNQNEFVNQSQPNQPNQQQKSTKQQPTQQPPKKQDPMSLVQNILEEVEKYEHEIDNFKGQYQDKQYRYLDEYLTRAMLKLDNIDVSCDSNLKQARKNALNYINRVISKLEKIENQDKKQNVDTKINNDKQEIGEIKNDEKEKIDEQSNSNEKQQDQEISKETTVGQENDAKQSASDQLKVNSRDDELKKTDELETENDKNKSDSKDDKTEKSKDKKKKTNEKSDEKKEKKKIKKDDKKDKKEDKKDEDK